MAGFSFDFSDFTNLSRDLDKIAQGIARNERAAVRAAGQAYQHDVQVLAPVDTGQYRASIRVEMQEEGIRQVALIGTPMPQACRLEYGFFGMTDRLGRLYHQYPRPHWRPPFDQNKEKYGSIMVGACVFGDYGTEKEEEWALGLQGAANYGIIQFPSFPRINSTWKAPRIKRSKRVVSFGDPDEGLVTVVRGNPSGHKHGHYVGDW